MTHYNTTNETGETLKTFETQAKTQQIAVLAVYLFHKTSLRPSVVHRIIYGNGLDFYKTPITSTRRAITNLTNEGKLIKTDKKAIGLYGRPEYYWKLAI